MRPVRQKRLLAGLCVHCGKHKAENGPSKRCNACRDVSREYTRLNRGKLKQLRETRAAAGLCMYCGKVPATHGKRCTHCRDRDNLKHKEWLKTTTAIRLSQGLCKSCGKNKIAKRGASRCNDCMSRESSRNGERQVKHNAYARQYYQRLRLQVIMHYTNGACACQCCGEKELSFLTVDHTNNDGAVHRQVLGVKGGIPLFRTLIKNNFPEGFQILCWNCNYGKHLGGGVCPHQKGRATANTDKNKNCSLQSCKK